MTDKGRFDIAVLITCYNRKQKTLQFLQSLVNQSAFDKEKIDIYLLNDGSTDGTPEAVASKYPFVKILNSPGNLFWAGGMRVIWEYAIAQKHYDLFLLVNDDIELFENSLERLLISYGNLNKKGVVLVGSTLSPTTKKWSYGGYKLYNKKYSNHYHIEPDDNKVLDCHLANGNILLVDAATVNKIGVFLDSFTHFTADFDYTYTAHKAGIDLLVAPGYYAYCEDDHGARWLSGKHSLKERIKFLYSHKGLTYKEYLLYIKKHFPSDYFSSAAKLWLKTLFPIIWDKFKKRDGRK